MANYKPPFVVVDFETEENGFGSTEFYRPNFKISSAAFSWLDETGVIKSEFILGEYPVLYKLESIAAVSIPLVAHNAQFEIGCINCRYPEIANKLSWLADTMRLVQVYDNGGDPLAFEYVRNLDDQLDQLEFTDEAPTPIYTAGLGLVKSCMRILKEPDHKVEAYKWIRENVPECKNHREGKFLNRLPPDLLERYNVGDTEATLKLFLHITKHFDSIKYDWRFDHQLYFGSVRRIVEAKIRGVAVDRMALETYKQETEREITGIGDSFRTQFLQPILRVERERMLFEVRKRKTFRGRKAFVRRIRQSPDRYTSEIQFNVGSNKQLASLFVGQLSMPARFTTDKGQPSFRSAVLDQWGNGGLVLKARRKRLLVLKQTESLLSLTAHDGRWHTDLKACGTATGRFAGGSV